MALIGACGATDKKAYATHISDSTLFASSISIA
jgi:hypothetical protein